MRKRVFKLKIGFKGSFLYVVREFIPETNGVGIKVLFRYLFTVSNAINFQAPIRLKKTNLSNK